MAEFSVTIRRTTPADAPRISELGASVFVRSYQAPYDEQDMRAYLKEKLSPEKITEEINSKTAYYFVAETDSIIGFVKFNTYMWTPRFKGKITFEVERLYIQKNMEGKNIGSRLMQTALTAALQKKYKIIWLSVWSNNTKAIAFHQRHGFKTIGDGIFAMGTRKRKYLVMQHQRLSYCNFFKTFLTKLSIRSKPFS